MARTLIRRVTARFSDEWDGIVALASTPHTVKSSTAMLELDNLPDMWTLPYWSATQVVGTNYNSASWYTGPLASAGGGRKLSAGATLAATGVASPYELSILTEPASGTTVDWDLLVNGASVLTGSTDTGKSVNCDRVKISLAWEDSETYQYIVGGITHDGYFSGLHPACEWVEMEFDNGAIVRYEWDGLSELDDWTDYDIALAGGKITSTNLEFSYATALQIWTDAPPTMRGLTALLSPPAIQRVVASQGTGQLQDRYASGALADILTGSLVDDHPELLHLGAGAHHLGLVWQRGDDIAMTTGTGVPGIGGWPQTVQTVALDRSHPTACVIDPTLDAYMAYLQSGSIALGCPASWSNGSFAMGTETIISSGDVATERGQLLWTPQAKLLYVYRDTSGAVVIRESADRGKSWA